MTDRARQVCRTLHPYDDLAATESTVAAQKSRGARRHSLAGFCASEWISASSRAKFTGLVR